MIYLSLLLVTLLACQPNEEQAINQEVMAALGNKFKTEYTSAANDFQAKIDADSTDIDAYLGLAESNIILYVFGYAARNETIPVASTAYHQAVKLDSANSDVIKLSGILSFLDWDWKNTASSFRQAIKTAPENLNARHWYSLYLSAMGQFDAAMAQSDTISSMDPEGNYLIGRGSLLYFARRNKEMKSLMREVVAKDNTVAWSYDWLGMAHIELKEYDESIAIYQKAFALSDGTVEVGAGLGHALGQAGYYELAKQMADYYATAAEDHYLPPVQRAFVHIGIGENEMAMDLLEQAYDEHSWFLIFMQVEPWLDPLRKEKRFKTLMEKMNFPVSVRRPRRG